MMKALKIFGYLLGALALFACLGATYIHFKGVPTYTVKAPELKVAPDSARIAEGKRLAGMTCAVCHRGEDGKLSGRCFPDDPQMGKNMCSTNLTQDPQAGIGLYTDGELAYLLRTGIKRSGEFAPPWMPRYNHISDEDLACLIAYLRSTDPAVQPSPVAQAKFEPSFLAKALTNLVIKPLPYDGRPVAMPAPTDQIAFGRYLMTGRYGCYECHSASFQTVNQLAPEQSEGYLGGGNPLINEEGQVLHSANLTPDKETGLGNWTEAQFAEAVRFAKRPDGRPLRNPMPPFPAMTDAEVSAIWAYLRTVPAVQNPVERNF